MYEFQSEFACGLNVLIQAEYRCYCVEIFKIGLGELNGEMSV